MPRTFVLATLATLVTWSGTYPGHFANAPLTDAGVRALAEAPSQVLQYQPHLQILVSEDSYQLGGLALEDSEQRTLDLKGRSDPIQVRVLGPTVADQLSHADQ